EGSEDASDLLIEKLDRGVIVCQVPADDLRGLRPGRKSLVTNRHLTVVERVLRQEIWRERRLMLVVPLVKRGRCGARVVRRIERHVAEERSVVRLAPEELDSGVSE